MRTLKKTLCLVLSLVMVLGLCAFNVTAADFTDAAQITHTEAVDVLSGIGVIKGMGDGTFAPNGTLTRAEACTILTKLMGGDGITAKSSFADCKGHWGDSYIAYCEAAGVVAGYGDGNFGPDDKLTGSAWGKMLLVAMGFDAEEYGFESGNKSWEIGVAKLIKDNYLAAAIADFDGTQPISRDNACELAFQGMQTSATGAKTYVVTVDDKDYKFDNVTDAYFFDQANGKPGVKVSADKDSLMAVNFPKLVCDTDGEVDDLNRTAYTWKNGDTEIGTYGALTLLASYTTGMSAVMKAQAAKKFKGYDVSAIEKVLVKQGADPDATGNMNSASVDAFVTSLANECKNGVIVEVYGSAVSKAVKQVVVITPTFTTVTVTSKAATKTVGAYTQYTFTDAASKTAKVFSSVVDEDADITNAVVTGTIASGDKVLVYEGKYCVYIEAVDTVSGLYTAKNTYGICTVGGKSYPISGVTNAGNPATINPAVEQTFYVDSYGNILGVKAAAADPICQIIGAKNVSKLVGDTIVTTQSVTVVLADGTVEVLTAAAGTVDDEDASKPHTGDVRQYRTSSKGITTFAADTYTGAKTTSAITNKSSALGTTTLKANAKTKFYVVNYAYNEDGNARVITGTVTTYTGIANVPSFAGLTKTYAVDTSIVPDRIADIVFLCDDKAATATDTYVYLLGTWTQTSDGYAYDAIVKGEITTVDVADPAKVTTTGKAETDPAKIVTLAAGMYAEISTGADTNYTKAVVRTSLGTKVQNNGNLLVIDGTVVEGKSLPDAAVVYTIDTADKSVDAGTAADLEAPVTCDAVYVVYAGKTVSTIYILVH